MNDENDLANTLVDYCDPSSPLYDPDFDREIGTLRPDWFEDWEQYVREVRRGEAIFMPNEASMQPEQLHEFAEQLIDTEGTTEEWLLSFALMFICQHGSGEAFFQAVRAELEEQGIDGEF